MAIINLHWQTIQAGSVSSQSPITVFRSVNIGDPPPRWIGARIWLTSLVDDRYLGLGGANYMGIKSFARRLGGPTGPIDVRDFGEVSGNWPRVIFEQWVRHIFFGVAVGPRIAVEAVLRVDFMD